MAALAGDLQWQLSLVGLVFGAVEAKRVNVTREEHILLLHDA